MGKGWGIGRPEIPTDLASKPEERMALASYYYMASEGHVLPQKGDVPHMCGCGREPSGLIELGIGGKMGLGNEGKYPAVLNHGGCVV